MLYDMIPSKVERFIFMPYLEKLLAGKGREAYWSFLESVFGYLYYDCATNLDCPPSGYSKPFLYEKIHNLIKRICLTEWFILVTLIFPSKR